ncbi:MAG: cadmium-translocating P-type ATPase [Candidatus Chaera renei]|uniref:Cadmium-translocating P-type ATPase n=1 Tax=Candidatus Chaera renei TaxID=2506947 RepID=A0A4Q0AJS6_9BACT|nr:MAG: cadmium-translocating P-type ATPase [Candidatus Chaera renei]
MPHCHPNEHAEKANQPAAVMGAQHSEHSGHDHHAQMMQSGRMSFLEKFKMSMTMTMGMEHGGLAGREMARMMELDIRNKFFFALALSLPIIAYSPVGERLLGLNLPTPLPPSWLLLILTTPVFFYAGWIFLYSSYHALKQKTLNMAVLIALGITAAYGFSVALTLTGGRDSFYEAAALLITFVLFGHWMEMKSRRGTTDALQALFDLVPPKARRIGPDGREELVDTAQLRVGDLLVLKPGDKVPVDGVVSQGETSIDEALVSGESLPVPKAPGDEVVAGSINQSGTVRFKATKVGSDTALAQIVKMVETAQNSKAPGQRLADRFAGYLVILAASAGLLTFGVWYLVMGQPLIFALTLAISTVVIACPDALGLATPTAVAVGTGLGAKHSILIKDAATLEGASKIQAVVLDKTGTLTEGKPVITDIAVAKGWNQAEVLALAAAAESGSSHPLSAAVLEAARQRSVKPASEVSRLNSIAGHGIEARVAGRQVLVGTAKLLKDKGVKLAPVQRPLDQLLEQGKTVMLLAVDGQAAGVLAAQDPIKPTAAATIKQMRRLGLEVAMITGDNRSTAQAIARQLGIQRVFAEVLPADKASYVKKLQKEGKFVAMVGDGVNDAPALAQADIGIAIGAGTDVAIETAKVVLMKSDPADILKSIILSKATVRKMKQNLAWASVYNLAAIPVAAGVLYPPLGLTLRPEVAALLMSVSSIIVAVNAVLLGRAERQLV